MQIGASNPKFFSPTTWLGDVISYRHCVTTVHGAVLKPRQRDKSQDSFAYGTSGLALISEYRGNFGLRIRLVSTYRRE